MDDFYFSQKRCLYLSLVACDPEELKEINMSDEELAVIEQEYMIYCEQV